jgi:uncharacterized membrane protein YdbT with pleckstrin-like domain
MAGELLMSRKRRKQSFIVEFGVLLVILGFAYFVALFLDFFSRGRFSSLVYANPITIVAFLYFLYRFISLPGLFKYTKYEIYERRLDITIGGFNTRTYSIWLHNITDVIYSQGSVQRFTGDASITVKTGDTTGLKIIGLGNADEMRKFWNELRDAALIERRAMHKWWV